MARFHIAPGGQTPLKTFLGFPQYAHLKRVRRYSG